MSFGQDLLRTSQAAQAVQFPAREAYVQQTLDRIKRCCQNQANNGGTSCSIDVDQPMYPVNARDVVDVLNQRLQELGFESVSAQLPADQPRKIRILASWRGLQPQRTQTHRGPQGMIGRCPICYEDQQLVALMLCGHTVCNRCQQSVQLRCPMCRCEKRLEMRLDWMFRIAVTVDEVVSWARRYTQESGTQYGGEPLEQQPWCY